MARKDKTAAIDLETALRSDGAQVVASISAKNTIAADEFFAFDRRHGSTTFGRGTEHAALNYLRFLNAHDEHFILRRLTIEESASLRQQQLDVFIIADELEKIRPTKKVEE